jgi:hypothetical protein
MTRLGRASALLAVFAGDYAILMLINGQLTDFDVSAGICAVALLGAALFVYVFRLSRKTLADGRAAVWERRDREASPMIPTRSPLPAAEGRTLLDSGVVGFRPCRFPRGLDDRDRATGSGPDSDEWMPAETAVAIPILPRRLHGGCTRTTNTAPVKALTKPKKY